MCLYVCVYILILILILLTLGSWVFSGLQIWTEIWLFLGLQPAGSQHGVYTFGPLVLGSQTWMELCMSVLLVSNLPTADLGTSQSP